MSRSDGMKNTPAPNISIVTPAYNCDATVQETIDSVLAQTLSDWEMIVVNDNSKDGTADILEEYAERDSRIKVIHNLENLGASGSRNRALELIQGRYICFLDADDYWAPDKLKKQMDFMKSENVSFCFHDYMIVDENGNQVKKVNCPGSFSYKSYLKNNKIGVLTIMLDVEKVGVPYMYNQPVAATVGTWLKILRSGVVAHKVPGAMAYYRITSGSLSRNKLRSRYWYWRALTDIMEMNPFHAFYYTLISSFNAVLKNHIGKKSVKR